MIDGSFRARLPPSFHPLVEKNEVEEKKKKEKKYTNSDIIIREECRGVAIIYDDKDSVYESEKRMEEKKKSFPRAGKVEPR